MQATVIDTLRYANRLKNAGVDGVQAEAMALAINDELVSGLATKDDLNHAVGGLQGKTSGLRADVGRLRTGVDGLRTDVDGLRTDVDGLRVDVDGLRVDVGGLQVDVGKLRTDVDGLRTDVNGLRGDVGGLRDEMGELRVELGALNGKFETQGRYVFLVLALIAALGLFNAAAPHLGRTQTTANAPPDVSAPPSASAS